MKTKPIVKSAILASCLLAATSMAATATSPTSKKAALHTMMTSLKSAKSLSKTCYQDGTNVVVVNFRHHAIEVLVSELHSDIIINPIYKNDNVYYIYSAAYYPGLHVTIYDDATGEELSTGYTENPSTIEVRDSDYALKAAAKNAGHHRVNVTYKHGV